uniref:CN hydrolase domain-containing protein n=1 Tax=Felis catus TaxID=9685 RepID=A0ABI7YAU8_FELCA
GLHRPQAPPLSPHRLRTRPGCPPSRSPLLTCSADTAPFPAPLPLLLPARPLLSAIFAACWASGLRGPAPPCVTSGLGVTAHSPRCLCLQAALRFGSCGWFWLCLHAGLHHQASSPAPVPSFVSWTPDPSTVSTLCTAQAQSHGHLLFFLGTTAGGCVPGSVVATYRKTHLCDVEIPGQGPMRESNSTIPGPSLESPVSTPAGKIGLAICYDMRFPELSLALAQAGAEILTYPSAFGSVTGPAHWEVLLRARAIETQCYVVAAAQCGRHHEKRASYGHSMVVDPWGTVVARCSEGPGLCLARIDLRYLRQLRQQLPVFQHRRPDLYGSLGHPRS